MNFDEIDINLTKEIKPCYVINGGESFLTTCALSKIEKAINLSFLDINKNVFYDSTTQTAKDIVASCEELPFCDNKRLVVVHDYLNKKNEQEKKIFLKYLKSPNPTTCLVFFSTNKSEFFSSLEKSEGVTLIDCEKLSVDSFNKIVESLIKNLNLNFETSALNKFKDYCNYSITKINTELNKLKTIFLPTYQIKIEDIEENVVKDIEYAIFDLTNAISKKDKQTAFLLVDNMLKNKEQPVSIISTISNHFRRLFFIARSEFSNFELAEMLNVKEWAIKNYREQIKNFSVKRLKEIFDLCILVEYKCKSGEMEAKTAIIFLISSILN